MFAIVRNPDGTLKVRHFRECSAILEENDTGVFIPPEDVLHVAMELIRIAGWQPMSTVPREREFLTLYHDGHISCDTWGVLNSKAFRLGISFEETALGWLPVPPIPKGIHL